MVEDAGAVVRAHPSSPGWTTPARGNANGAQFIETVQNLVGREIKLFVLAANAKELSQAFCSKEFLLPGIIIFVVRNNYFCCTEQLFLLL